ncbi:hypothetical protein HYPSUDRAFT_201351 [Hypholoma sublateritium FD-334 SS-4]|uniref:N-acetyltransferase domain-containing protein n=1 Tax=Hypholoma sublateritium (strain FD-334 SS-4) TaxID=945553 RepID=A0A0D2L8W6_HYPSF|nr:hypothetical protein HYPSUDRAFT_201351 [Hypholoma sublateritium FD-334 SS-4]
MSSNSSDESDYVETKPRRVLKTRPRKRVKYSEPRPTTFEFPLQSLLSILHAQHSDEDSDADDFQSLFDPILVEYLQSRAISEKISVEINEEGARIRPLRHSEIVSSIARLSLIEDPSSSDIITLRKLKLERERNHAGFKGTTIEGLAIPLVPLPATSSNPSVNPEVLEALYSIKSTPFANSFLARLHGQKALLPEGLLGIDWETRTPWMNLMNDIRDHYSFSHPDRECPAAEPAPITYSTLQASQLPQINDLLARSFWAGIDVSDSLEYWPERSTVVAMYKKIIVGVAIISSPIQTYITYLAVKAGWDKAQIARTMLYHLIKMNPTRDFTLHVSTNNSAMLLYNQFGFKAEGFVANFYSAYLDPNSRASKNAYMLRLRHV